MEKDSEQLHIDQPRKLCCLICNRTKYIDTNKETVPLLPSVDNTKNSPKSEPSDVDKEQNNEVKILKNKYHPQHWLYLVLLMK